MFGLLLSDGLELGMMLGTALNDGSFEGVSLGFIDMLGPKLGIALGFVLSDGVELGEMLGLLEGSAETGASVGFELTSSQAGIGWHLFFPSYLFNIFLHFFGFG